MERVWLPCCVVWLRWYIIGGRIELLTESSAWILYGLFEKNAWVNTIGHGGSDFVKTAKNIALNYITGQRFNVSTPIATFGPYIDDSSFNGLLLISVVNRGCLAAAPTFDEGAGRISFSDHCNSLFAHHLPLPKDCVLYNIKSWYPAACFATRPCYNS